MIPYKEKKEAIESLLSQNINPSMEALQYYFPTLIGQCRAQNALSDLVNIADYIRHKYVSRNVHVQLQEFQAPVQKQVRLYSRKKAAKKAAPRISTSDRNDNCNHIDEHDTMTESSSIQSRHETEKTLPRYQGTFEEMTDVQTSSFRFQSRTRPQPIPCTQKADEQGFAQVKHIVNSMMKRGEWPNYPTFCKLYPDLGQKYQKQSLTNTISRLRLLFDPNGHEKECHEEESTDESQELQNEELDKESTGEATEESEESQECEWNEDTFSCRNDKLDEDSTGEAIDESDESQECEWNEDTFIHRQIACTEQSDPKGFRKIRHIVLALLQQGQEPSFPLFVEKYPNIVAKYRERSLMSAITKVIAEEGKRFLLESSDSENEDEDTVVMDASDSEQDDEMNDVEMGNESHFSMPVLDETPHGVAATVAGTEKTTIRDNDKSVEKPVLKEHSNLLHMQAQQKCPTCFSVIVDSQMKCSTCSSFLTETYEDEDGNKISLNSSVEIDESVHRGKDKRKISDVTSGDCSNGENDALKTKKRQLQISPNNVTADDIVNEVDESAIDSSILVCERLSDGNPGVEYTTGHVLHPVINCNNSEEKNEDVEKTMEPEKRTDETFSSGKSPLEISGKVSELFFSSGTEKENSTTKQNDNCKDKEEIRKSLHSASSNESPQETSNHADKNSSERSVEERSPRQDTKEDTFNFINEGSYSALNDIQVPLNVGNSDSNSSSSHQNPGELTEQITEAPKKKFAVESFDLKSPFGAEKMSLAIWFNKEIIKVNTPSILSKCKEYSEKFVELGFYNEDMIKGYCTVEIIDSEDFQWMAFVHRLCLKKWISNAK